ncbi:phosphodiester glycosidase family protein [Acetivibrio thermocellus]|nr:phosphodiester glycosidase family protein [Acetivibrio thermocellus]UWV47142.1 phosphodiester glycosidase family protein [Acetivibrio thermocellus]HOP92389.1 phosphodiester glycosidase family protein [Acetivibrio thermocellus]
MKNKVNIDTIIYLVLIITSLIFIYAGSFLFEEGSFIGNRGNNRTVDADTATDRNKPFPVVHKAVSTEINGIKQKINILEIDLSSGGVKIKPALAFDTIYGFQSLKDIAINNNAYAAVNAGFFYSYGEPSGMVVIDGKVYTKSTGKYPVFVVQGKNAFLSEIKSNIWILHGNRRIAADDINREGKPGETVVYTPVFGPTNRADKLHTSYIVENNRVARKFRGDTECKIPSDGMVITFYEPISSEEKFEVGDWIGIDIDPDFGPGFQAYECGSWLVRDGQVVAVDRDDWVGLLTNRDPRTAIGVKHDGKVVLVTVDGRQPGYSVGLSSRELAGYLLTLGIKDAAMLDGGASTQMIVQNKTVNRLPARERMLGGGIVVVVDEDL